MSLEKEFIKSVIDKNVSVYLSNGVKLQGKIVRQDDLVLTIKRDGVTQLVYKPQIATIMPHD